MRKIYLNLFVLFFGLAVVKSASAQRVEEGLLTLHSFHQNSGNWITDLSGNGTPLFLQNTNSNAAQWANSGGLQFHSPGLVVSQLPAEKVISGIKGTGAFSAEVWFTPENNTQNGPARILTLSSGSTNRNFTIGQDGNTYAVRNRTTQTSDNGTPQAIAGTVALEETHLVYTFDETGAEKIYINGQEVYSGVREGDLSNWNDDYHLGLGNEIGADRSWLGTIFMSAIYSRALSASEVENNFSAGHEIAAPTTSDATCVSDCFATGFGDEDRVLWLPNLPFDVYKKFKFVPGDGHFEVFDDGTAHLWGETVNLQDENYGFVIDVWFKERRDWEAWSALGREWKGNANIVGDNYLDWDYYIMDPEKENVLIGTRNYEGDVLPLTHRPANYQYGFQVGLAANDQNANMGMSCWFDYVGELEGEYVCWNGDLNLEGGCVEAPVLTCAVDVAIDCGADASPDLTGQPVLSCPDEYTLTYSDETASEGCDFTLTRTWVAISTTGQEVYCAQQITWSDTSAPVFIDPPADITVDCESIPEANIEVEDDCGAGAVTWEVVDLPFSGQCLNTIQRIYTATDACGNSISHTQYIALVDEIAPVFANEPEDILLQCGDEIADFIPVVFDNCDPNPVVEFNEEIGVAECGESRVRTWTASDVCGNVSTVQQIIYFEDSQAPTSQILFEPQTVDCAAIPAASTAFLDNCTTDLEIDWTETTDGEGCNYTLTRNYSVSDACGNTSSFVQIFNVEDNTAPAFDALPENLEVPCGTVVPVPEIAATDNCGEAIVEFQELQSFQGCGQIVRTWRAVDLCGNTNIATQTIDFIDTEAPVFTNVPADENISCGQLVDVPEVNVTDNCDTNPVVVFDETTTTEGCNITITRTWTATDACGNTAVATQTLYTIDEMVPSFSAVSVLNVECYEIPNPENIAVQDDCLAALNLTWEETTEFSGDCTYTIVRTYNATDACGNVANFTQAINVTDNTPPSFEGVAEVYISCDGSGDDFAPVVSDICDANPSVSNSETTAGEGCDIETTMTYVATDACGNTTEFVQTVRVLDTEAPILSALPLDMNLDCSDAMPVAPVLTATDNCTENVLVTFVETIIEGDCPANYTVVREWTAIDDCENTTVGTQNIYFTDTTIPVFGDFPGIVQAECGNLPEPGMPTATDDCSAVTIVFQGDPETALCPFFDRVWVATDACGNSAMLIQTVYVEDNDFPVFSDFPEDAVLTCSEIPPFPDVNVVDNCDDDVALQISETTVGSGCEFTIIRTFIATDDCGNSTFASQQLMVTDTEAPIITEELPDITAECGNVPTIVYPEATDDCAQELIWEVEEEQIGEGCNYQIVRTFTVADACGNTAATTQNIYIEDTTGPVIQGVPFSTFVSCNAIPALPNVSASDACGGEATLSFDEQVLGAGCSYQLQRTWTATDVCGNSSIKSYTIFVNDNEAPVFESTNEDLFLNCGDNIPEPIAPVGTDNCTEDLIIDYFEYTEETACGYAIVRTWSTTDACGNTATAMQNITVEDQSAPVIANIPANATVGCGEVPAVETPTATDDCADNVLLSFEEVEILGACPFEIQRIWTAVDDCGNTATATQSIYVLDTIPPVLSAMPADEIADCNMLPAALTITATDDCSENITVDFEENTTVNGCQQIVQRTWSATDKCGNAISYTQTITLVDETAPQFENTPVEYAVVECSDLQPMQELVASDNCSSITQEMEETITGGACENIYTIVRTWTVSDACGNTTSTSQTIAVVDTQAPDFTALPEDEELWLACEDEFPTYEIEAEDQCAGVVPVLFEEEEIFLDDAENACVLNNAVNTAGDVVLLLPNAQGMPANYRFDTTNGTFNQNTDAGTVHITGYAYEYLGSETGWYMDVTLKNAMTWAEWSALGRSYKDETGFGEAHYSDWTYYILDAEQSQLIGLGAFEGDILNLDHAPADYYYGFQLGEGANNRNEEYGISGWFFFGGMVNGQDVSGGGDIVAEVNCCAARDILRTWTATDCQGNTSTFEQIIHVRPTAETQPAPATQAENPLNFTVRDAGDQWNMSFNTTEAGPYTIQLRNASGKIVEILAEGNATANENIYIQKAKDTSAQGLYLFVLQTKNARAYERKLKD